MKPHPTIPHRNLQPASGKCNLQLASGNYLLQPAPGKLPGAPSRVPLIFNFQLLKVFNFQLLLLLATITLSCTDEKPFDTTDPTLPVHLNPGEQAVTLTLGGMGKAAAEAESAIGSLSRAASPINTIETEAVVNTLAIYCFVNLGQDNTDVTAKTDYTLERVYKYAPGGESNDFVLVPAADGYQAAIGIPKDDRLRYFLAVANDPENRTTAYTATPVGNDRTSASTYTIISMWKATATVHVHLLATSPVPKRIAMNDGSYTEVDEPFSAADLTGGLPIVLSRLVARLDISNPASTGFIITSRGYGAQDDVPLFPPYTLTLSEGRPMVSPIDNAEYIPGFLYLYPHSDGKQNTIRIHGTLHGVQQILTVEATLKCNTRYLLRVRNDGNNVSASIEVAPWNEDTDIDAPVPGEYNAAYTIAPVVTMTSIGDDGSEKNFYSTNIEQSTRTIRAYSNTGLRALPRTTSYITVTGASGDEKPVGVIIPPAFADKITLSTSTTTASGAWQVSIDPVTDDSGGGGIIMSDRAQISGLQTQRTRPESCTLTFVTRAADGTYKYDEWTFVLDIFTNSSTPLDNFPTVQVFENGALTDITNNTFNPAVYLPAFAEVPGDNGIPTEKYIYISSTEYYTKTFATYSTGDWLFAGTAALIDLNKLNPLYTYALDDNFTGKERRAQLITRRAHAVTDDMGTPVDTVMEERRYTVIQLPVTAEDEARMASSATIRLESGHKTDELYTEGTTIHVQPFASNNSGGIIPRIRIERGFYPFSVLTPGGKPVIINLPDVDWITIKNNFTPSQYIFSGDMLAKPEETPPGFFRQFILQVNTTGQTRRAYFDIITLVDGKRVTTTYSIVQYPAKSGDGDHAEEM